MMEDYVGTVKGFVGGPHCSSGHFESSGFCWVLTDKRPTLKRPTSEGALGLVYSRPKIRLLSNCIMGVKNRHW